MPMKPERYEEIMTKLNNPELPHSERGELLQELRGDYSQVLTEYQEHTQKIEKLTKTNEDLLTHNSFLFAQSGITKKDEPDPQQQQQSFSETVTIDELLKEATN